MTNKTSSLWSLGGQCSDLISITQDRNVPLASTPIIQQEPVSKNNHPDTQTSLKIAPGEKKILEHLQCDQTTTIDNVPEYNPEYSSIKGAPDCDKCETLQLYITYCEKMMSSIQEKLSCLKAKHKTTPTADGVNTTTPARPQTTPTCTKLSPNRCVSKPSQKTK